MRGWQCLSARSDKEQVQGLRGRQRLSARQAKDRVQGLRWRTLAAKVASIRFPHIGQRCKLRNAEGGKEVQLPIALCRKGILYIGTGDGSILAILTQCSRGETRYWRFASPIPSQDQTLLTAGGTGSLIGRVNICTGAVESSPILDSNGTI
jgi:hypothetical protein